MYEEKSLGIFEEEEEDSLNEESFKVGDSRATIWSRYLAMHMRRQLAFGASSTYLSCIRRDADTTVDRHVVDRLGVVPRLHHRSE